LQEQSKKPNNPFLASTSPTSETSKASENKSQGIIDLFSESVASNVNTNQPAKASDDLLCLGNANVSNPFADVAALNAAANQNLPPSAGLFQSAPQTQPQANPSGMNVNMHAPSHYNTNGLHTHSSHSSSGFASDSGFASAFGTETNASNSTGN